MDLSDTIVSKSSENARSNVESYEGGMEVEPLSSSVPLSGVKCSRVEQTDQSLFFSRLRIDWST